jgi:hypothetical protein
MVMAVEVAVFFDVEVEVTLMWTWSWSWKYPRQWSRQSSRRPRKEYRCEWC